MFFSKKKITFNNFIEIYKSPDAWQKLLSEKNIYISGNQLLFIVADTIWLPYQKQNII